MFLQRADDNTGKIEEIVDEKLTTSGFVNADTVTEMIAAAQLEPVAPDVYLTKSEASSTYSTIGAVNSAVKPVSDALNALTTNVTTNYATKHYVAEEIAKIPSGGGGGDVTKAYVDEQISTHKHNNIYYTKTEVDTKIAEIPSGGGGDVTKAYVDEQISTHNHDIRYYTKSEVDEQISTHRHDEAVTTPESLTVTSKSTDDRVKLDIYSVKRDIYIKWSEIPYENSTMIKITWADGTEDSFASTTTDSFNVHGGDAIIEPTTSTSSSYPGMYYHLRAFSSFNIPVQLKSLTVSWTKIILEPYATKSYVDGKIAEIPSGGGKIEVIDNDLTINGNLTTTGLFNTRLETWQEYDDYVNRYPSGTFQLEYQKHDDTSKITKTFPKNIVKTIYPGQQIVGEWKIDVFLDSEGNERQDFHYEFNYTFGTTVENVTINENVSFEVTDDSYKLILDQTAFKWSLYYGCAATLLSCKIHCNDYTTFRYVPDGDNSEIGVSNTKNLQVVTYDNNFTKQLHVLKLLDQNGNTILPGNLVVNGTVKSGRNSVSAPVDNTEYITKAYVDEQISTHRHDDNDASTSHTHNEFNDLTINGTLTIPNTGIDRWELAFDWLSLLPEGEIPEFSWSIGTINPYILIGTPADYTIVIGDRLKATFTLANKDTTETWTIDHVFTTVSSSITVHENILLDDNQGTKYELRFYNIPTPTTDYPTHVTITELAIYKPYFKAPTTIDSKGEMILTGALYVHPANINGFYVTKNDIAENATTAVAIGKSASSHQCGSVTYKNSETPEFGIGFWYHDLIMSCKCKQGQTTPDVYLKGNTTITGNVTTAGWTHTRFLTIDDEQNADNNFSLFGENGSVIIRNNITRARATLLGGSQTVTHETNIQGEIGTFCETNGGIYDGYEKIDTTDCICQAVQSTTLNAKIVGIITSESQFASHGDVLMKVVQGTYKLGDILCPDISGLARVATETEKQYMMLNAIPRPKITSLNTGTPNVVACFVI